MLPCLSVTLCCLALSFCYIVLPCLVFLLHCVALPCLSWMVKVIYSQCSIRGLGLSISITFVMISPGT